MRAPSFFPEEEGLMFPAELMQYFPSFLDGPEAMRLLDRLQTTVPWRQQTITLYGKPVRTPRLTAWYGDEGSSYRFSGARLHPHPWTPPLRQLKQQVEAVAEQRFNSVLLNLYRDGQDSVAWHSDDEPELGSRPVIASVSLGEERKFEFRKREDHTVRYGLVLGSGSLLVMQGDLQRDWEHRVPKSAAPMIPRINLTFRTIQAAGS